MRIRKLSDEEVAEICGDLAKPSKRSSGGRRPQHVLLGANVPLTQERAYWGAGAAHVVGVDEAGNGAICAALFAAAVELPPDLDPSVLAEVRDSKLITSRAKRQRVVALIRQVATRVEVHAASPAEIHRLKDDARALAMRRALRRMGAYDVALIDGAPLSALGDVRHIFVPHGERLSLSIACASLVAKVARDELLSLLGVKHLGYGWERNQGYATNGHRAALATLGPTSHHHPGNKVVRAAVRARTWPLVAKG